MLNKKTALFPFSIIVAFSILTQQGAALAREAAYTGLSEQALGLGLDPEELSAPQASAPAALPPPVVDTDSEEAIISLNGAEMMAATPEQRLAMLKTLVKNSRPGMNNSESFGMQQEDIENAIYRLLESAPDAASFDSMYYHVRSYSLHNSVSYAKPIKQLVKKQIMQLCIST